MMNENAFEQSGNSPPRRTRREMLLAVGLCGTCGKNPADVVGAVRCTPCHRKPMRFRKHSFFIDRAKLFNLRYKDTPVCPRHLLRLWIRQKGRCPLTGRPLTRRSVELDHIHARSKGGSNAASNLRWLDAAVNKARYNFTDEEFVALCKQVIFTHLAKVGAL
jgi:5-methylcytosine-specific restriction endonuclease McrA